MEDMELGPPLEAVAEALRREFDQILRRDFNATLEQMCNNRGKVVLNSDDLFKMLPQYAENPAQRKFLGHPLYPVAAKFTDDVYRYMLNQPASLDDTVVFTAGGSATGKSTILRKAGEQAGVNFIVDTTFATVPRALEQVELALAARRKVEIYYVYRDFSESIRGMLERSLHPDSGRVVPIDDMARTHYGAQQSILEVSEKYQDNPNVSVRFNANKKGRLIAWDDEDFSRHLYPSVDRLCRKGQNVLDELYAPQKSKRDSHGKDHHPAGQNLRISKELYEAARSQTQEGRAGSRKGDA